MAKTVNAAFRQFASNVNITDRQTGIVSSCRETVVRSIKNEVSLHPQQSLLIGSYDRNTMPRYLSRGDVDVMVIMHYGDNKSWDNSDGTTYALQKIRRTLQKTYPKTPCGVDRNCVTLQFLEFRLDVVPAFKHDDGYYKIPDTYRKEWLPTSPKGFGKRVTQINSNMRSCFIPFVKMIKSWNEQYKDRIRGFHLECMLADHYQSHFQNYTYESMAAAFLGDLPTRISRACYDPITGDRLDGYLGDSSIFSKRITMMKRARRAADQALKAVQFDQAGYKSSSIQEWRKIFGEFFPAYG